MIINYKILLFVFSPVLLLVLLAIFKDRFEPTNKVLKSCNWSLLPSIIVLFFFLSAEVIKSLWYANLIPILKKYPYNPLNWEIFSFFFFCLISIFIYVLLRYAYKVSIIEVFNLKLSQIPFILKLCAVLAGINILTIYFLDLNILLNPQKSVAEIIKAMNTKHIILFSSVSIVLAPIVEESIFRGLLYSPLHRKAGRCFAMILSALFWTQGHFEALLPSVGIFIGGVVLAWLYDRSGSLIHPIVFHMFKNSWLLVYYFK